MTPPRPPRQMFAPWAWYRRQSKNGQGCIATLTILIAVVLCCTCAMANAHPPSGNSLAVQSTSALAGKTQYTPTGPMSPTPTPTPSPKPSPTPTPRPTLTPVLPTPTPVPTQLPAPTPTPAPAKGINENPWGYDFNPGDVITDPPAGFCTYFSCISSFWKGQGYVVQCRDGKYSKSGGRSGACSRNGGSHRHCTNINRTSNAIVVLPWNGTLFCLSKSTHEMIGTSFCNDASRAQRDGKWPPATRWIPLAFSTYHAIFNVFDDYPINSKVFRPPL